MDVAISSVQSRWGTEPSFDWGPIQHWAVSAHHQHTELCQDDKCYWQTCLYYSMFFPNGVLLKTYPMLLRMFVRFGSERKGRCKTWHLFHLCFKYLRLTKLFISITTFIFSHIWSSTRIFFTVSNYSMTQNLYNTQMVLAPNTQRTSLIAWTNPAGSIHVV